MARFWVRTLQLGVGVGTVLSLLLIWVLWHPLNGLPTTNTEQKGLQLQTLIETRRGIHFLAHRNYSKRVSIHLPESPDRLCRWVEPWFANKTWPHTHLIFYGKPIMQAVKSICVHRHWKMTMVLNDSSSGLKELERLTSVSQTFIVAFTSSRALRHSVIQRLANSTNALVSAIRYAYKITGAKKGQLEAFRKQFHLYDCNMDEMKVMPRSFLLDNPSDCVHFFKYANSRPSSWWVLKTSQGYGGDGITVLPNLTSLHNRFGTCSNKHKEFIVQEYLSDLLLVEGRKFDVRALVLIAGTSPYMLFYHNGYLRVSVKDFNMHGDRSVHLTNSHVQVHSDGFAPEKHFWSFERFQEFLDRTNPRNDKFVERRLIPFIKKISLFILKTGMQTLHAVNIPLVCERSPASLIPRPSVKPSTVLRVWE